MTAFVQFPLQEAYQSCRQVITHHSTTFYWGTQLFPQPKRQAMWAVYCWCRRTDELVDSQRGQRVTLAILDQWEHQLEKTFAGHPESPEDAALAHAVTLYPLEIQPFRDLIAGMRMDLTETRYETFEDLYVYCYRVAGTVGLMSSAIMGYVDGAEGSQEAVALGVAMQLTNILRDVGEDARRGRIYIPRADMERFGYTEEDLLKEVLDGRWCDLMRYQIQRTRDYYAKAESGIRKLQADSRWPVWASLLFYRGILDQIERNGYQNFNQRAFVSDLRKLLTLPTAWLQAQK
ncbi:phytoene synthase [Anthocerotibacter panamensis]|uniref:phytoene synthase n=1 Tax=Anthocerotibacter panamensis TaxID=2857077 RepID=UPI001C405DF2|nr:phytoene synthase [Anthocerotibacter panamensis]